MAGFSIKMSTKGQLTLPKEVRNALGLAPGVRVDGTVDANGNIVLMPNRKDPRELFSTRPRVDRVVSIEEMDEVIAEALRGEL